MRCSALSALVVFLLMGSVGAADTPDMAPEAKAELAAAIDALKAHHINRASVDWPSVEAAAYAKAAGAKTAEDAYPAIRDVIAALKQKHTFLQPASVAKAIAQGSPSDPNVRWWAAPPEGFILAGGIGYLRLPQHQGTPALDAAYVQGARDILRRFARAKVCRILVDLRGNGGGNMSPMVIALSSLLGPQPYGFWDDGGAKTAWSYPPEFYGRAPQPTPDRSDSPLAVLIGADTASSGEFTAMAIEGRPRARFFGAPTGGYLTGNHPFALPDGAMLLVSEVWGQDRLGRSYRDAIRPDQTTADGQPAIDAAIAWLKTQSCRR